MQVVLKPVICKDVYADLVEPELLGYFDEVIFGPLFGVLAEEGIALQSKFQAIKYDEFGKERINASTFALEQALRSGKIWYSGGAFGGTFNAAISRELHQLGAKKDALNKVFVIEQTKLPISLRAAVSNATARSQAIHDKIGSLLKTMQETIPGAATGIQLSQRIDSILKDLDSQFVASLNQADVSAVEAISVAPELEPPIRQRLTEVLTENLNLSIKNFSQEKIPELRRMVEQNWREGGRLDRLAKMIEAQYGVAERKAAFLARQETSLLASHFREERARAAGSLKYVWQTRHDNRVRHDHKLLDGKTIFWDDPPIVNQHTGMRAHAGEDFGCRCVSLTVIELPALQEA